MRFCRKSICGMALVLAAGGANAQSSVTLYGIADAFVQFLNNGGKQSWSQRSGGSSPSRFGIKGTEELGGGLKAVFTLENGFNINNGAGFADTGAMFYRQSWVGLTHEKYGTLTFGRQYQPTFWVLYPGDPFSANEVISLLAAAGNVVDRNTIGMQTSGGRSSNSVVYKSPKLNGLQLLAMYAFQSSVTQPAPQTNGNIVDVAATWSGYGLYAGIAYQYQHPGTKTLASLPSVLNTVGTEHFNSSLAYQIGIVNLQFLYGYHRPKHDESSPLATKLMAVHPYSVMQAGATIQATTADTIEIAALQRAVRGVHDNMWAVQLGIDHSLSKRTAVYARAGYMKNNGSSTMSWSGVGVTAPGTRQTLAVVGVTQRF
ncbi:porin [Paraburkholderia silviterrae]|uniref:Porin n=1 Tax=Paraburkholderia silviterrae TaxID=2528715 RepID=A0A4R5MHF6_9BURK|nr:porin [Paraburkholderia silviterrae]TDG26230.1 porin [Paraburkholderia silviterrae]